MRSSNEPIKGAPKGALYLSRGKITMTREEAFRYIENIDVYLHPDSYEFRTALNVVIESLKQIKYIISMPNTTIQEDVVKYKMICETISK